MEAAMTRPLRLLPSMRPSPIAILMPSRGGFLASRCRFLERYADAAHFFRVPSYNVASRGALGGGPVPLSSFIGLPSYEESSTAHSITSTSPTSVSIPSSASPTSHGAHSPTFPQTRS